MSANIINSDDHNSVKQYTCTICNKSYKLANGLSKHLLTCTYSCKGCAKTYKTESGLTKHMLSCSPEKKVIINIIQEKIIEEKIIAKSIFECKICNKICKSGAGLASHFTACSGKQIAPIISNELMPQPSAPELIINKEEIQPILQVSDAIIIKTIVSETEIPSIRNVKLVDTNQMDIIASAMIDKENSIKESDTVDSLI